MLGRRQDVGEAQAVGRVPVGRGSGQELVTGGIASGSAARARWARRAAGQAGSGRSVQGGRRMLDADGRGWPILRPPTPDSFRSCDRHAGRAVMRRSSSSAPRFDSGSLRLPHLGDCTHEGQPSLARALPDQPLRVPDQPLELVIATPGDPHPAGMPLVDEDRRPAGLGMGVGRQAPDVPSVAHGDQRQHRDLAVLERVQRAEQLRRAGTPLGRRSARRARTTAPWSRTPRSEVEPLKVDHRVVLERLALVAEHHLGVDDRAVGERHTALVCRRSIRRSM